MLVAVLGVLDVFVGLVLEFMGGRLGTTGLNPTHIRKRLPDKAQHLLNA